MVYLAMILFGESHEDHQINCMPLLSQLHYNSLQAWASFHKVLKSANLKSRHAIALFKQITKYLTRQ